jgi:microcystin-dependent protein
MSWFTWSQTASSNATADPTVNWAEGQAPSSVNDSARAMMAATAKYRDDISGAIVTGGTSTAYSVSSYSVFDTLAHMNGQMIAFTPHTTNGATVTLNVDSLGAVPLRSSPGVELPSGTIIQGTPYAAIYNTTDGAFYLRSFFGTPYSIPVGAGVDYWASGVPNSSFALPHGQALSRTVYSTLFSLVGVTYGTGDGSTTFNIPDKRGRISVPLDTLGGAGAASRVVASIGGVDGQNFGAAGGVEAITLAQSQLPNVAPSFTGTQGTATSTNSNIAINVGGVGAGAGGISVLTGGIANQLQSTYTPSGAVSSINGGVAQVNIQNMPPSIVTSYIMRII